MCDMTHSYASHDSFICVTWLIHMCHMTHSYVRHDSFICVTWLNHMCDMAHYYVWSLLIHTCVACTRSSMCICIQNWCVHVTCLIHMCIMLIHTWYHESIRVWHIRIHTCAHSHKTDVFVWHDWFMCIVLVHTWYHEFIRVWRICSQSYRTDLYVWNDLFMCSICSFIRGITNSYVWDD